MSVEYRVKYRRQKGPWRYRRQALRANAERWVAFLNRVKNDDTHETCSHDEGYCALNNQLALGYGPIVEIRLEEREVGPWRTSRT